MDPDVTFVGFDLTVEQITPAPGWYFIIAEQPTEPRFGMDLPPVQRPASGFSPPVDWSDLHWGHVDVDEGAYLKLAANPLAGVERRVIADSSATASFGRTSADFAAMTFQRPGRAAIHSSKLVEGVAGAGDGGIRPILARSILLKPLRLGGTS
jgi:hypothetical protein